MFKSIDLRMLKIEEECRAISEKKGFVKTCDLTCQVGTLHLWCYVGEHGPYEALLSTGDKNIELRVSTDGSKIFSIRLMIDDKPFEEYADKHYGYDWYKKQIGWEGDFSNGWKDFSDPVDFHRVVTGLWGILGVIYK